MSLEEEKKENQNEGVSELLNEEHKAELGKILAFGEKYKKKGEEMEQEFWEKRRATSKFRNLLADYENKKEDLIKYFESGLLPEERKMLSGLSEIAKVKFYKQYIYNVMLYGGNPNYECDGKFLSGNSVSFSGEDLESFVSKIKNGFKPGMVVFIFKKIGDEGVKVLAKEWKDGLQPGMSIDLYGCRIGDEGARVLAKEWKHKLKPGMKINLMSNDIGDEGIKAIAKEWKHSLQPGMCIDFSNNDIGDEGIKAIAKERKKSLKPGIQIHCREDGIGDEGIKILAEEWKDSLKPNMQICLIDNKIGDEGADAMIKNLQLTDGVMINVERNNISYGGKRRLKNLERLCENSGMHVIITVENDRGHDMFISTAAPIPRGQSSGGQSSGGQFSGQITFTPKRKK